VCEKSRVIEAFTIQVPERIGKELIELIPSIQAFGAVISAFIESIMWRHPHSINLDVAPDYINAFAILDLPHHDRLLNALLTVAANHDHPLNADLLHQKLLRFELVERDSWWSIFLSEQYHAHGAVDRLVDWAWSPEDKAHIADESVRLCGVALAWFLTTSNRFLRDRATKALVRLLTPRIHVLRTVIQAFIDVNDPYVFERLMAVAYGCSMRSEDIEAIRGLAADIYTWVFRDGHPPVHILARDYARGVIEVAVHRGIGLDIDPSKVRPPYNSTFPDNIPTEEELKAQYHNFDAAKRDIDYAQSAIWLSVMYGGDFARYVIGTNGGSFEWSSRRLGVPPTPTCKERYETFVAALTPRQKKAVERFQLIRDNVAFYHRLDKERRKEYFHVEFTDEQLNEVLQVADGQLHKQLGQKKSAQLSNDIRCDMENPDEDEFRFDLSLVQRWILQRVFELGWTLEKFGRFDRYIDYQDMRDANKPERIGQKYQWIAYHEFLARVADNFEFRGEDWYKPKVDKYDGPWQGMSLRDIDPSWVLPKTKQTSSWDGFQQTWWAPAQVQWDPLLTDTEWIRNSADLPAVEPLIAVIDPRDNSHWLTLKGSYRWEHVNDGDNSDSLYPKRTLQYSSQSYIVKQADAVELFEWMKTQWRDTRGFSLRDSNPVDRVFFGEFCWAPAFLYQAVPYYSCDGWVGGKAQDTIPKPILLATDQYAQEDRGFDCSIDKPTRVYLPCQWIAEGMNLRWRGIEGYFYDAAGNLIAFDPSVNSAGPGALLINRKLFLKYLSENGYTLLWHVIGEKLIITDNTPGDDWPGRLEILGVLRLQQQEIDGKLYTRLSE
jgi:hypothetical protein